MKLLFSSSFCNCPRCRRAQVDAIDRRVPFPHFAPCNSNWVNPVDIQNNGLTNAGYIPPTLPNQPPVSGHIGMPSFNPVC